ncbi:hypothetical protein SAMN02910409_1473 [Prevotellaceae bacterium HUN156]|jgi:tetratricopeptide (TPR) repeat protein|nr:hypothetical protein SAMN02910409_1473 [Prevotellaceae bacterium HUN156]
MKKIMMMAIAFMASSMAFAGDSDALKAVMKSKNYAEAVQLLKQNLGQMADNTEKAKAYNHLVDLAMGTVTKQTAIIAENQMSVQLGRAASEIHPYDTLGLADAICDAIESAVECDKYDQQPNAKGKVAPKFSEKNAQRVWAVRHHLVNIGQDQATNGNKKVALKYWGTFALSNEEPFFAAQDHSSESDFVAQVAFFAGRYAYDEGDMEAVRRYLAIAKKDAREKENAVNLELFAIRHNLKNHADSLKAINELKAMYEAEPENDAVLDALNGMYDAAKDRAAQNALLDNHLAKYPTSFAALANKGLIAMGDNDAVKGAEWLQKAAASKPDNAVIFTYLGICYSSLASTTEDSAKSKEYYKQAIDAFDKAKELDPDKQMANWGYNRYQAYYGLYGEDDARTKAAEADR